MPAIKFDLSSLILLVFGLINFPLSIWILRNNPKSWTNRLFSGLIISLTIYLIVNTELYLFEDHQTRLFIGRAIMANAAILNVLVFLFLSIFPGSNFTLGKKVIIPILIATAFLFITAFTNLIFQDIIILENNTVTPVPGKLLPLFAIHTIVLIFGGLISIIRKRKKAESLDRIRINYIFLAFGLLFFFILTFNFIFPVVLNYGGLVPFLPIYILIFLGIVSYAIVRHRLFGLRILATQIITITIWLILLSNLFAEQDNVSRTVDGLVLLFSIISGILLIRSVIKEVEQREKLEELTLKLKAMDAQKNELDRKSVV